jgi:hypothetical protein
MIYLLTVTFIIYFIHTLNFAIKFNRSTNVFSRNQKLLHNFLIWIIPFIWIIIIKGVTEPTPGSNKFKKTKQEDGFYESGIGVNGHDSNHHN